MNEQASRRSQHPAWQALDKCYWDAQQVLRSSLFGRESSPLLLGLCCLKYVMDVGRAAGTLDLGGYQRFNLCDWEIPDHEAWWQLPTRPSTGFADHVHQVIRRVEESNTTLQGIFSRGLLQDLGGVSDEVLRHVIFLLSGVHLGDQFLDQSTSFADWLDYQIAASFYLGPGVWGHDVPPPMARFMVKLAGKQPFDSVMDPACGVGNLLVAAALPGISTRVTNPDLTILAQESDSRSWALAKFRLLAHGFVTARVEQGDSLSQPRLLSEDNQLLKADLVVTSPPFGGSLDIETLLERDVWGRFMEAKPARNASEAAFVMHALSCLTSKGKAILIVPFGLLFRSYEQVLRDFLVRTDTLEAVIRLPGRLWQTTALSCALIILNNAKRRDRKGHVLFIDPSLAGERPVTPSSPVFLNDQIMMKIQAIYESKDGIERGVSKMVSNEEILAADASLDPATYLGIGQMHAFKEKPGVMLTQARELEAARGTRIDEMDELLKDEFDI